MDASDDVVASAIYINALPAYVLFDCDAKNSFISRKFAKALDSIAYRLNEVYRVGTPRGKILLSDSI